MRGDGVKVGVLPRARGRPFAASLLATGALVAAALMPGAARAQEGPFVYVPNGGDNDVSRIDIPTDAVQAGTIAVGSGPPAVAVRGDQSAVYVANTLSNTVSVIDTATNAVTATIGVGTDPGGLAISPDGRRVYVANNNSSNVSVIDTATNTVTATIAVGTGPSDLAVSPDNRTAYAYYLGATGSAIAVIDTATNTVVSTINVGASQAFYMAMSPSGGQLYIGDPDGKRVFVVDLGQGTVTATIPMSASPLGLAVSPDGSRVYVTGFPASNHVSVIDTATNTVVATILTGFATIGVTFSPDGSRAYVTEVNGITVGVIDTNTLLMITTLTAGNSVGRPGACGNGNALLTTGNTFVAKQSGAIACTGVGGPVFTGGTMQMAGAVFASDLSVTVQAQGGTITGNIAGTGGLIKNGPGALVLADTSSYTGATTVNAGTLVVNGSIASSSMTTVNAGGALAGAGTVGHATINGGTLSPGNSIGTLTISGNLTMTAASTYLVEISPGNSDFTHVTGTANLAGTVHAVFQPGTYTPTAYLILLPEGGRNNTAFLGGLTTTNLPANFTAAVAYSDNEVLLMLSAALGHGSSLNRNQQRVADVHSNAFNAGGVLPSHFAALFGLTGAPLGQALAQLSGEVVTGIQRASHLSTGLFLNAMVDPFIAGRRNGGFGAAMGYAPAVPSRVEAAARDAFAATTIEQRWSVWGAAYGGRHRTDGDPIVGSNDLAANAYGFAAGTDYRVSPSSVIGAAVAIGETRWSVAGVGKGNADVAQVGGYASTRWGALYVSSAVALAWHRASTDRTVTVAGADRLEADLNATGFGGRIEGGYRFGGMALGLTPYAAVQVQGIHTPSYGEVATSGSNQFALSYTAKSTNDIRSELGAWLDTRHQLGNGALVTLRGRAAWVHDYNPGSRVNAAFQTLPGTSFTVDGAAAPRDAALTSAVAEVRMANGVTLIGKFDGEFASGARTIAGTGTVKYAW